MAIEKVYKDLAIQLAESIDESTELMHYGVKGMKWGVRKGEKKAPYELKPLGPDRLQVTTKHGETLTLHNHKATAFNRGLAKISKAYKESYERGASIDIKNADGKSVGTASFNLRKKQNELYLNWVGIDSKHQGKGYASAVLDASEKFGRELGVDRMLLEVPGSSPDARHIYSKMGFESTNRFFGHTGDIWGGLEEMEYRFNKTAKHSDDPADYELAHFGIKGMKWGVRREEGTDGTVRNGPDYRSPDAKAANYAKSKAATLGVSSLSNEELQTIVTRDNLMMQYARLNPPAVSKGKKVYDSVMTAVEYGNKAVQVYNSPAVKAVRKEFEKHSKK